VYRPYFVERCVVRDVVLCGIYRERARVSVLYSVLLQFAASR